MATHGLQTALTLYRSGTLTLEQAAARAGRTVSSFERVLEQYGIDHTNIETQDVHAVSEPSIRAD
ncbi:DUF7317 family protein [Natronocalculus amylovorans]|uniref:UPF0175 family protein n=1 Tax=Natronocalculus amylovorans TaxID=2917812 RepID=A0AAE3K7X6_9EURY|nr:UPF0175 family protein [Natronocalculus amylovorans]MCL9815920.1 UPF0175 family protein [Natronocalculus amylovorans]NUE01564.1 UPF0175 family protein [Halorubraceae archaeon YAN]